MYKLTDTFVLILLIFAVFLSVAYTTLNKLFAVFFMLFARYLSAAMVTGRYKNGAGFGYIPEEGKPKDPVPLPISKHLNSYTLKNVRVGIPCRAMESVSKDLQPFCVSIVDPENPGWYFVQRDGHVFIEPDHAPTNPDTFDEDASFICNPDGFYPGFSTLESVRLPYHYVTAGSDNLTHVSEFKNTPEFKDSASCYDIEYHRKGESTYIRFYSWNDVYQ